MYTALRAELARYREIAAHGGFPVVPTGPTLEPGARGPRVAALRARLAASGDLAPGAAGDPDLFDAALEEGVRAFQRRLGIDDDGRVGPATQAALAVPIEANIEQIRVNLERGRWLLHDLAPTFVVVNVAGFRVYYLRDGELVWSTRAMVGKPYRQTPLFRSEMTYLVLNPTWTVPPSILANDILPAQRRDPALSRQTRAARDRRERRAWCRRRRSTGPARRRATSASCCARSRDRPTRSAASSSCSPTPTRSTCTTRRAGTCSTRASARSSSGCIRVENPLELAALLLEGQSGWDRAAIDRAVEEGKTRTVTLAQRVPVLLTYWTAWVDIDGKLQLRRDVYGRDPKVARGLAERFRVRQTVASR